MGQKSDNRVKKYVKKGPKIGGQRVVNKGSTGVTQLDPCGSFPVTNWSGSDQRLGSPEVKCADPIS